MLDKIENLINALEANQSISVIENGILENRRLLKYRDAEENFEEVFNTAKIRVPKEDWKYEDLGSLCIDWDQVLVNLMKDIFGVVLGFILFHQL